MLIHTIDNLVLRCDEPAARGTRDMALPSWWGTELRGMVKEHFKREVCSHPEFSHADDAPLIDCSQCAARCRQNCPYALCFEPLPAAGPDHFAGSSPGPLVLAASFPESTTTHRSAADVPKSISLQHRSPLPFGLVFIGRAVEAINPLVAAIKRAGPLRGLGPTARRIHVTLDNPRTVPQWQHHLALKTLPTHVAPMGGQVPRVQIELTAPLRLLRKQGQGDDRELITEPSCEDLLKAALDVITTLARFTGEACSPDRQNLLAAAARVTTVESDLQPWEQHISARHSSQRAMFESVVGSLTLIDVPIELLPWLVWGGKLHVGDRRTAGAGSWRIHLG